MWKRKIAGKWLRYMGIAIGFIAFLTGIIGCLWKESPTKFLFLGALIAGLVFLMVYAVEWAVMTFLLSGRDDTIRADIRDHTRKQLLSAADSFEALSEMVRGLRGEEPEEFTGFVMTLPEIVCTGCEKCRECWEVGLRARYEAVYELYYSSVSGNVPTLAETEYRLCDCERAEQMMYEFSEVPRRERNRQLLKERLEEGRFAVSSQLSAVSDMLRSYSGELYETAVGDGKIEDRIVSELYRRSVYTEQVAVVKRKDRGLRICLTAHTKKGHNVPARRVAKYLSILFGCPISVSNESGHFIFEKPEEYVFEEEPGYMILTGKARAAKYSEVLSGDSFSFVYPDSGETVLLLSDGMGSGTSANRDSEEVIRFLEQLLSAGFDEKTSVRLIDSLLLLKTEGKSCASVDISVINPYSGTCEFIKLGASGTFIKREGVVEGILSESMPIGILKGTDCETKEKKLYDGDYVIMMSDGVADALSDKLTETILKAGREQTNKTPQRVAAEILKQALLCCDYRPKDDMTVLAAELIKKNSAYQQVSLLPD